MKKLTIIIPTYERRDFMLRAMQYWSGKEIVVIFLDGSKIGLDPNLLVNAKSNIIYIHRPVGLYERTLSAISLVNTEYVMFGCDDEFYIPSALDSCLAKLLSDSNLVSCGGRAMGFNWNEGSILGFNVYDKLKDFTLDDPDPTARSGKHFSNYVPAHYYSICRTSIWKIAVQQAFSKKYNFYASSELQFEFLISFSGKSLIIPELMWLRSDENTPVNGIISGTSPSIKPSDSILRWWIDKKYKKEKEEFLSRMEAACRQINRLTRMDYISNLEHVISLYIKYYKKRIAHRFFVFFNKNFPNFPISIKIKIKDILKYFGYGPKKNEVLFMDKAKLLNAEGVKVDFKELKKIQIIINLYYKKNKV
jgi:glycosyltransferase domain-containing protein